MKDLVENPFGHRGHRTERGHRDPDARVRLANVPRRKLLPRPHRRARQFIRRIMANHQSRLRRLHGNFPLLRVQSFKQAPIRGSDFVEAKKLRRCIRLPYSKSRALLQCRRQFRRRDPAAVGQSLAHALHPLRERDAIFTLFECGGVQRTFPRMQQSPRLVRRARRSMRVQ